MLSIRHAGIDDLDAVFELIQAIAAHHNQQQYVTTCKTQLLQDGFSEQPKFKVLLAEIDSKIAGYASYSWMYSIWRGKTVMNLDDLFVWEQYRGQKIGQQLMQALREVCSEQHAVQIRWEVEQDNHGAIRFYRELGADVSIKGLCRWQLS
ncbi:GNAT family N-acetyltransferase [Neptunicella marina]|uniref:GNAT family N-acetyltransferase n=1 Tax=Neptunicella marina TaxID=2125989 RepID=A0A8J6M0B2_9ALTE|nr:GNAT family N-acetyltransferase [Neptunicella marina]MBC3767090.1 GNAT family N-acetyltransferase [Neptunicella marina]